MSDLAGIDVGFSVTRPSTGMCRSGHGGFSVRHTHCNALSRQAIFPPVLSFDVLAIDGPVLPGGILDCHLRTCEHLFQFNPFRQRCKPGLSHGRGQGQAFRQASCDVAVQFHAQTKEDNLRAEFPRVRRGKNIVEAFPNAFLGVMLTDDVYEGMPRPKRGKKFDWLLDQALCHGRIEAAQQTIGWEDPDFWGAANNNRQHDERAALVCAMTAACVLAGKYVAVGEPASGYFFLPPWCLWERWAKDGLDQKRQDNRVNPQVQVWIDGTPCGRRNELP